MAFKILTINGTEVPSPTTYDVRYADIDSPNSGRGDSGYMNRERIRAGVVSIEVGWTGLKTVEKDLILQLTSDPSFSVKFLTGTSFVVPFGPIAQYETKTMYAGDKQVSLLKLGNTTYWNVSFTIIEI